MGKSEAQVPLPPGFLCQEDLAPPEGSPVKDVDYLLKRGVPLVATCP